MNSCDNCIYARGQHCHRYAPQPTTTGAVPDRAVWPLHGNQGCGDFKAPDPLADGPNPRKVRLGK